MPRGNRCGWTRPSLQLSEKRQKAVLVEHKCHPIYSASEHDWTVVVASLRERDELWMTTLARLASPRLELNIARKAVRAKKAVIVEALTGRRSDKAEDAEDMAFDAAAELMREARGLAPEEAAEYSRRGGLATRARWKRAHRGNRMPVSEARGYWKDHTLSNAEALAKMWGWTQRMAYRHPQLGPRGKAAGRPKTSEA